MPTAFAELSTKVAELEREMATSRPSEEALRRGWEALNRENGHIHRSFNGFHRRLEAGLYNERMAGRIQDLQFRINQLVDSHLPTLTSWHDQIESPPPASSPVIPSGPPCPPNASTDHTTAATDAPAEKRSESQSTKDVKEPASKEKGRGAAEEPNRLLPTRPSTQGDRGECHRLSQILVRDDGVHRCPDPTLSLGLFRPRH